MACRSASVAPTPMNTSPRSTASGRSPHPRLRDAWHLDVEQTAQALADLRETASRQERPARLGELEITITPSVAVDLDTARRYADLGVHRLAIQPQHALSATAIEPLIIMWSARRSSGACEGGSPNLSHGVVGREVPALYRRLPGRTFRRGWNLREFDRPEAETYLVYWWLLPLMAACLIARYQNVPQLDLQELVEFPAIGALAGENGRLHVLPRGTCQEEFGRGLVDAGGEVKILESDFA